MKHARLVRLGIRLLPVFGALLLSGGMLAAWFTGMAWANSANSPDQSDPQAVLQQYDFDIVKSSDPQQFIIGSGIDTGNRYRINVRINALPYPLSVNVKDVLPVGVTISDVEAIDWNCAVLATTPQQVSCEYSGSPPPIVGNAYPPIFLNVNLASSVANLIVNKAELYLDNILEDNAVLTTTIDSVDLSLTKKVSPQYADIGDPILYTYVVKNNGPATATGVKVVDSLPVGLIYTTSQATPPGLFSFTGSSTTIITGTWTLPNIVNGGVMTLTLPAAPTSSAVGKKLTNVAKVSSSNLQDRISSNNTASADFFVSGLEIDKSKPTSINYISVGEPFTYTITVRNTSTSSASGVVISDVFDPGLSVTGAKLTVGSTVTRFTSGNSLSRSIGTLPAGGVATLDVGVRGNSTVTQPITVTNMATVRASPSIVRTSNITNTGVVTITPAADFTVLNTNGVTAVNPGQLVTYTVTIQNIGSVITHTNFIVTDELVSWLDFVSVDLGTLVYTPTNPTTSLVRTWQIGERLDPSEAISYKLTARVSSNAPVGTGATTHHRVEVNSPDDKYLGNNVSNDIDTITTAPVQDYDFILKIDRTRVEVGEGIHFIINLINRGNTIATSARVTDVFPSVLDIVDGETTDGTLTINSSTRTVTVNIGTLFSGQQVEIGISTKVNSSATTSAVYEHNSVFTFNPTSISNPSVTIDSNTVEFSVLAPGAGVLPGTGIGPPAPAHYSRVSPAVLLLLPFVLLLPLVVLGRRWSSSPQP